MSEVGLDRRSILKAASSAAAIALGAGAGGASAAAQEAPFSSGSGHARTPAPTGAVDCHHHIYDHRYPVDVHATLRPDDATVADYRKLQARTGTSRNVVVQPSTYGVDNSLLLASLAELGNAARGVAVVNTEVTDAELKRLDAAGVRGIRFNLVQAGATTVEMIEPLAKRVTDLGWHVQLHMLGDQIIGIQDILARLPCQIVFDHRARLPMPAGITHPAFAFVSGLTQSGRAWVKLSGAYMDTKVGPPTYADTSATAVAFFKAAPERVVWGSDWPHPTEKADNKPDDALLFDLLATWVPDGTSRRRVLVQNPQILYGFDAIG
jgi:predicted TIM-barrel fold metal-dependent hydrolase